jgi:hypothetical protein
LWVGIRKEVEWEEVGEEERVYRLGGGKRLSGKRWEKKRLWVRGGRR